MSVKVHEIKLIPVKDLVNNPWNPQVQTPAAFEMLGESIAEDGFMENLVVVPRDVMSAGWQAEHPEPYVIVWGEHRWRAASRPDVEA